MTRIGTAPSIAQQAERRLREADLRFSRCVFCKHNEGVLLLQGQVPTFHLKQIAQTVVAEVPGVEQVDNQIQVLGAV